MFRGLCGDQRGRERYENVTYAYDELGRLIAVVDNSSGNAAQYIYDAVGNLQQIKNTNGSTVSIFTFTPNNGRTV